MAENDFQSTLERAVGDLQAAAEWLAVPLDEMRAEAERLARQAKATRVLSRSELLQLLESDDAQLRVAAIRLLSLAPFPAQWEHLRRIARVAQSDPEPLVRGVAWDALLSNCQKIEDHGLRSLVLAIGKSCAASEVKPSGEVVKELSKRADTLRGWLKEDESFQNRVASLQRHIWRGLADMDVTPLLQQRDAALDCLRSEHPARRAVAVAVLVQHWNCAAEYRDLWMSLMATEADPQVRERLVMALGTAFEASEDRRCLTVLASIVLSEAEAETTRAAAYRAMLRVAGSVEGVEPRWSEEEWTMPLHFPADIDFDFVRRWG